MASLVRTIHLCTALLLSVLIGLYALSGFLIVNGGWFRSEARSVERAVELGAGVRFEPGPRPSRAALDAFAWRLRADLGLRGRPERERPERRADGTWLFRFGRPGTVEEVVVAPGAAAATLTVQRPGLVPTLKAFHHVSGFDGGPQYRLWAGLVDVVGLALLLFPASGIVLWYRRRRQLPWGWLALGAGATYVLGSLVFLLLHP